MEKTQGYIQILPKAEGQEYSTFYVYLPAGAAYWAQYRFVYMQNPVNIALDYTNGPNDAANCKLFRIRGAYIGTLTGDAFTPHFRALQQGEISLAFREEGAGDFCGGFHGDEVLTSAVLTADGRTLPLDQPYFGAFCAAEFVEDSVLNRCNTPELPLLRPQG